MRVLIIEDTSQFPLLNNTGDSYWMPLNNTESGEYWLPLLAVNDIDNAGVGYTVGEITIKIEDDE